MTLFHFFNCVALTFLPPMIVYKSTNVSEFGGFSTCFWAALAYFATQFCKVLAQAIFLPAESSQFYLIEEVMKSVVNLIEPFGLYLTFSDSLTNYISGSMEQKIIGVGITWAFTESLIHRLLPLWIGARGVEFDWVYTFTAIEANLAMLLFVSLSTVMFLFTRKKKDVSVTPFLWAVLASQFFYQILSHFLQLSVNVSGASLLATYSAFVLLLSGACWHIHSWNAQSMEQQHRQ
eukprot:gnl/Spiro4/24537_TR12166_c0_g1_i1.p1 gnl/Spiro4/24537_TR12166_c0_g1~~gnl/Spiro4/24537_TR12166_c0_g1_i1.p1  ORF type:complete len:234 (-),score=43.53 gnl/Spiro4/24537_TR12166_c0_g1_i1:122-823(-)